MLIPLLQIIVSIALIVLVLLQERSSGLSGLLGGDGGGFYQARRGAERVVFQATIALTAVFIGLAVFQLMQS
jgi:protein translocase SecG subunit